MKVFIFCRQKSFPFVLRCVNCWNKWLQGTVWHGEDYGDRIINRLGEDIFLAQEPTPVSLWHLEDTATLFLLWPTCTHCMLSHSVVSSSFTTPGEYLAWPVAYVRWIDLLIWLWILKIHKAHKSPDQGAKQHSDGEKT